MDLRLRDKRALITGGSKGIGRASAEALAEEGCDLTLVARSQPELEQTADSIRSRFQVKVAIISADLSEQSEVERVGVQGGKVDILVNNAGAIPPGSLLAIDDTTWRRAWDPKVFGFISLTRAVYPSLIARKEGVIVNVIGSAGERFDPGYITGSAGNAALMAFTRALGREAAKHGVRIVGINPGPVATERMERMTRARAAETLGDEDRWRDLLASMPYGRGAAPEEIGAAVAFLASPRSGYTNGTILTIDGGG